MRFDIEGFITFDTEEASLVNLLTGDCIELSATSTRLLTSLLQYRGDIISRVDIFQTVFEKYGARPSNSNLNQYISTLRRSLADLGIEKNVIITVPRIGFKISDEVIITSDNDYYSSFTLPTLTPELPTRSLLWQHRKEGMLFILAVLIVMLFSLFFIHKKQSSAIVFTQDKCTIYGSEALHATEILRIKKLLPSGLDCSKPKKIYLFNRQIDQEQGLGIYMDIFILKCDRKYQQCHSYYYKEIKNA
ncbi:winged helix-turn-helix domain-containing protein [Klebsiella oxytoca]|uniref:Transcriptional regulator n=1 Tax=Klebsiella oxytoca TaxID=571 RepID=A0A6B8MWT6_KLEOX|nr:winged helix-turn-helix domain-containing protein [Klebsiella oxytoca]QGN39386.1 transcriptional regulator [Klebsiella oxytoca]